MRITESRLRRLVREAFVGDKERNAASAAYREMLQMDRAAARMILNNRGSFSDSLTKLMSIFSDSPEEGVVLNGLYCIQMSVNLCKDLARVERVMDPVEFENSLGDVIRINLQEPFCRDFPEICKTQSFRFKTAFVNFAFRLAHERDLRNNPSDPINAFFIDALPRALGDIVILDGEEIELGSALEQISSRAAEFAAETAANAEGTVIGSLAGISDPIENLLSVGDKIEAERNAEFWQVVDRELTKVNEMLDDYLARGVPNPAERIVSSLASGSSKAHMIGNNISSAWTLSPMSTDCQCSLWRGVERDNEVFREFADFVRSYAEFLMSDPPDKTPSHNLVVKVSGRKANLIIDTAQSAVVSKRMSDEINQSQEARRREKEAKERKDRLGDLTVLSLFKDLIKFRDRTATGDITYDINKLRLALAHAELVAEKLDYLESIVARRGREDMRDAIEREISPVETIARLVRNFSGKMIEAFKTYYEENVHGPEDRDALLKALKSAYQEEIDGTNLLELIDGMEYFMQVNGLD